MVQALYSLFSLIFIYPIYIQICSRDWMSLAHVFAGAHTSGRQTDRQPERERERERSTHRVGDRIRSRLDEDAFMPIASAPGHLDDISFGERHLGLFASFKRLLSPHILFFTAAPFALGTFGRLASSCLNSSGRLVLRCRGAGGDAVGLGVSLDPAACNRKDRIETTIITVIISRYVMHP